MVWGIQVRIQSGKKCFCYEAPFPWISSFSEAKGYH